MSILPVIIAPDPSLKIKAESVEKVNGSVQKLMNDMLDTMYAEPGIGLAAPQVGQSLRIIVGDVSVQGETKTPFRMVNPVITWVSEDVNVHQEGCLSLPQHYAEVVRPTSIQVSYLDEFNHHQEIGADGILATCLQHEIDHLNGILFVDHISALKRNMILRKLMKSRKI